MSLNLAHFLDLAARATPDQTAVILDQFRFSYAEMNSVAKQVANVLAEKGIGKGDKVAMMIPNTPHFPIIYYGILYTGAVAVPINVLLKGDEIHYHLEDSDSKAFFVWRDFYDDALKGFQGVETCRHLVVVSRPGDFEPVPVGESFMDLVPKASPEFNMVDTSPGDTAVLLYTSGTTGRPKGAELTHFNMFFNAHYCKDYIVRTTGDDVGLAVLPLFHTFGQTTVMNSAILAGCTVTMVPRFETEKVFEVIQRDRVTIMAAVPTMYYFMLHSEHADKYDLSSIRLAVSGGSSLPLDVFNRFQERFGVRLLEGYGLSETSPVASFNHLDKPSKAGSIGTPIWGCDMRIMRDDGTFAGADEVGEIVVRGHNVMKGYYKRPEATEEAIVKGWLHTGDLAKMDEEGYFFIVDRKKDIIIRGGMNVYPREIEEVLFSHPGVLEVAVVGIPDPIRGEEVKAFVTPTAEGKVTIEELDAYCRERLAKYKCPKWFQMLPELPKGPTGKVLKRQLRDMARP